MRTILFQKRTVGNQLQVCLSFLVESFWFVTPGADAVLDNVERQPGRKCNQNYRCKWSGGDKLFQKNSKLSQPKIRAALKVL
jgi:hypothetical protein